MTDLPQLAGAIRLASERRLPWCLATLYEVEGSSYRRPGACMVVVADGSRFGAVSGGCMEAEVAEHALRAIERRAPTTVVLNDDLDLGVAGFGTGCNGRMHVVLEPFISGNGPLQALEERVRLRKPFLHILVVSPRGDDVFIWRRLDSLEAAFREPTELPTSIAAQLTRDVPDVVAPGHTRTRVIETDDGPFFMLLEYVAPRVRLVVVGDGYDVEPVVRIASELHWETVVVGRRSEDELRASFPEADATRFAMHPEEVLNGVDVDSGTAIAILSHSFDRDRAALARAMDTSAFYIGVLGPRSRTERMAVQLDSRVHAPLGLDVGAETPAEIALALAAEIQATRRAADGARLRDRSGPIHRPVAAEITRSAGAEIGA